MLGVALFYLGLIAALGGAAALVTRRRGRYLLPAGLVAGALGLLLPARDRRAEDPGTALDELIPVWQFAESHSEAVDASCAGTWRAIHEVTAREIALFRSLTWIRRLGRPGPESILNAPERAPLLDVATRTGFLRVAEDPGREIVIGTIVVAPPGALRPTTPEAFRELDRPGFAKAAMNFRLEERGPHRCLVSTDTRVSATDGPARRRFARYWRVIYPGSALIRRMWLRAVKRRAEGSAADTLAAFMGPGISQGLAEHRARSISQVRYDLSLDLTAGDSAVGRVGIRFHRDDTDDLILDFRGRRLTALSANGAALSPALGNGAHIRVPASSLRPGENRVELGFVAAIAPSGAGIIRFDDQDDGNVYLYTLLVPADANQLFPCFDQPDLKARVTLTLRTPGEWTPVANGPVASADTSDGLVAWRFRETGPISTYLIAFAAGPWHRTGATVGGRTLNAYVRRTRAAEADLDSLLAINARGLAWMEEYFGRPYPFDKFDFVLAPAFPFGGMEHPGAVFYNEDRFIFRERPTLPRRLGRMSTILHEVAHMWFGDLATMRWFDDLWLKEGFATYMAAKALTELEPASEAWKTFHLVHKPLAYGVDQSAGTTPVWQELVNLDQAKSNYGPIVYNKAPSVLKQLEHTVGTSAFRGGVRAFLTRHAFGNATWQDLLDAIGRAADRELVEWGRHYILRPGMPELEQHLVVRGGRIERLELVQRPARDLSGPDPWPIRTQVLIAWADGSRRVLPVGLSGRRTEMIDARGLPAPAFVYANAEDHGYLLVLLDSASVAHLESGGLGRVRDSFLRAMLWTGMWDLVRSARMAPERFARLVLGELPAETDEQIVPVQLTRLTRALAAYLPSEQRRGLEREVERMLAAGADRADRPYGVRKAFLDAFIDAAQSPDAVARLVSLLAADSAAGEPLRDPTRWDAVTRLLVLGAQDAERHLAAQTARDSTPDGRRRAFMAGAGRPSPAVKQEYFTRYFADSTLNEDWATASLGAFNALAHQPLTRPYLVPALDSLPFIQAHRRIFFLGSWLGSFLGGQTDGEALRMVSEWLDRHPDLALDLRRKVLQHLDELERTVRIRRAAESGPGG